METHYNEHCRGQARTIQWICQMLTEHEVYNLLKPSLSPNLFRFRSRGKLRTMVVGLAKIQLHLQLLQSVWFYNPNRIMKFEMSVLLDFFIKPNQQIKTEMSVLTWWSIQSRTLGPSYWFTSWKFSKNTIEYYWILLSKCEKWNSKQLSCHWMVEFCSALAIRLDTIETMTIVNL